jgi:hypothetical protein
MKGFSLDGYGVALVLRSENADVAKGSYVYGRVIRKSSLRIARCLSLTRNTPAYQEYSVILTMEGLTFLEKDPNLPWTVYVGAAGMPGKSTSSPSPGL